MISVCIATYNGEKYIKDQLDSILAQIGRNDEIIISDDGSTDNTVEIIKSYRDSRIKIYSHKSEKRYIHPYDYCTHNFENALSYSKGDIIFLSDQDDVWLPDKVEIMCRYLDSRLLVISDYRIVDGDLNTLYPSLFNIRHPKKGIINNLYRNSFIGASMAFRRELLCKSLPFPDNAVAHDLWLGLLANIYGKVEFIDKPLILYRRHGGNVSTTGFENKTFNWSYRLEYRIKTVWEIIKRITVLTFKNNPA